MSLPALPRDRPLRFLIARRSAIGDCILTLPLVWAIREAFPDAHLTWAIEKGPHRLMAGHPAVNEFLVLGKGLPLAPGALWAFRRQLRAGRYDVALDPQSLTKSSALGWLAGAPLRIGFRAPIGREISTWLNNRLVTNRATHVVDRHLELLEPLGVPVPKQPRFDFPLDPAAVARIAAWLQGSGLSPGYALLNAGAAWNSKLWPAERYGLTARFLEQSLGLRSVALWGDAKEKAWAEQIVAHSAGGATLAPNTSLQEMAALIKQSGLFVGSDTGPLHLAAALGVRCVGLYGPTRREVTGPYGAGHQTVQSFVQKIPSGKKRHADNTAMQAIRVEQVCKACAAAMEASRRVVSPAA